jgi:hypothetical protein
MISTFKRKGARLFRGPSNIVKTKEGLPKIYHHFPNTNHKEKSIVVQIRYHLLFSSHIFSSSKLKQKPTYPVNETRHKEKDRNYREKRTNRNSMHLPASKPSTPIRTFPHRASLAQIQRRRRASGPLRPTYSNPQQHDHLAISRRCQISRAEISSGEIDRHERGQLWNYHTSLLNFRTYLKTMTMVSGGR